MADQGALPRRIIALTTWVPTTAREQQIGAYKIGRDFQWAVDQGWQVEYWGLRRRGPRGNEEASRCRGPCPPSMPLPLVFAAAWTTHFLLVLRNRAAGVVVGGPWESFGATLALRLSGAPAPLVIRMNTASMGTTLRSRGHRGLGSLVGGVERLVVRSAALVVPMGSSTGRTAREMGAAPRRIIEVPYPTSWRSVDIETDAAPDDSSREELLIVCAARLVRQKGVETLVRSLAVVVEQVGGAVLEIAGDGDERQRLEKLAASLGIANNVTFHGWLKPVRMPSLFGRASIAVLPSLTDEGLGMSLVEAGLGGCALVGSDVGGIRDIVISDVSGDLVPPGDPVSLARALVRRLTEPAETRRLGRAAREIAVGYLRRRDESITELSTRIDHLRLSALTSSASRD